MGWRECQCGRLAGRLEYAPVESTRRREEAIPGNANLLIGIMIGLKRRF
jgi:hypothetical protein